MRPLLVALRNSVSLNTRNARSAIARHRAAFSLWGLVAIAVVLLVIPHGQVCQIHKDSGHEYCSFHNALSVGAFYLSDLLSDFDTVITGVATMAIAAFTATLWAATRGMQKATSATLDHLGREFNAEHRPWVTLDCEIAGPLTYDGTLWRIPILYKLRNIGRTPATNVSFFASLVPSLLSVYTTPVGEGLPYHPPTIATDPLYELEGVCSIPEGLTKRSMGWGQVLFPTEPHEQTFQLNGNPSRFSEASGAPGYSGQFLIAACVSYGATFNAEFYRTAKAFTLYKPNGDIDPAGEVLPIQDLGFHLTRSYAK